MILIFISVVKYISIKYLVNIYRLLICRYAIKCEKLDDINDY